MDTQETHIYYSLIVGIAFVGAVLLYFVYRLLKQHNSYQRRMQKILDREMDTCIKMRLDIARDIHDDVGSLLGTLAYDIQALKAADGEREGKLIVLERLDAIRKRIKELPNFPTNCRALIHDLQNFIRSISDKSIRITIQCNEIPELNEQQCVQCSLLLREIIHNTMKHSGGTKLLISIGCENGAAFIKTADNGSGFKKYESGKDWKGGIGIDSILNRVRRLNGTVYMDGKPGAGVEYLIQLPLS